jgi:dihydroorotase
VVHGFKLYPAGATTNSDAGVAQLEALYPLFEVMEQQDVPLLVHGEVTDNHIDIFDREKVFIDRHLAPLVHQFPGLRVVLEHITTREGAHFVRDSRPGVGATITAHHLLYNRNAMLAGGIRPHFYCLPILKREPHRQALLEAATSGNTQFFLGTDSAPHSRHAKETACGCAGCYTAHTALELYAMAFESVNALDKLEAFASFHGADFYRLPRNASLITLEKTTWVVPEQLSLGDDALIPFMAAETIGWRAFQS